MTSAKPLIDTVVLAGEPYMGVVPAGHHLRIVDLEGNQAVDTLFYNALDTHEHYSAQDTIQAQGNIYLTTGSVLRSNRGRALLTIEDDTCGRHDTLGGAAPPRATPCAMRSTSATCTTAGIASCWHSPRTMQASPSATCPATSISS